MAEQATETTDRAGEQQSQKNWLPFAAAGTVAIATMLGFAYLFSLWLGGSNIDAHQTLRLASSQYVAGNVIVAGDLAAKVDLGDEAADALPPETPPDEVAETPVADPTSGEEEDSERPWQSLQKFLVGAGAHASAMISDSPAERRELLLKAIPALVASRELGFPDGRHAEGHRLLGVAMHEVGRYDDASKSLQKAIASDLTLRSELLPLLAVSLSRRTVPQTRESLQTIDAYLLDGSLDLQRRSEAELLRIELLNELGEFDLAQEAIGRTGEAIQDEVENQIGWAMQLRDLLALRVAQKSLGEALRSVPTDFRAAANSDRIPVAGIPVQAAERLSEEQKSSLSSALDKLGVLQREASPEIGSEARLLAARIQLLLGNKDQALAELTQVRQQRPFREQGLEGGLSEIELLANESQGEDVLQTTRYLVREIGQSRHINFSLQRESEFKNRVIAAMARLRVASQFKPTVSTAEAVTPILGSSESLMQQGITYRDWGAATLAAGSRPGGETSREASELARLRFRDAGDAFAEAAEQQFDTEQYVSTLWSAIESYQMGRHFSRSIKLLEKYLRYEERTRQPRGLVAHGRALLAEGRPAAAIDSLQTCIVEFPRDPMRYDARLLAAQAAADSGDTDRAEQWLRDNLNDGQLTPQSPAWRDSLFTLAEQLYSQSDLASLKANELEPTEKLEALRAIEPTLVEAMRRLDESVERYWPFPRAQAASYLLARANLLAAQLPLVELGSPELLDSARRDLRQKSNARRQSALERFASLVRFMDNQKRDDDLSEKQEAILRNSLLGQADTLKDMERFVESADAFRDMSLRYMNEPPALEALLGQSRVIRELGRDREADLLIRQAAVVLDRIGDQWDGRFTDMTRYDRAGWQRYLSWMTDRFDQASKLNSNAPSTR